MRYLNYIPTETVTLSDGREARLRGAVTADVGVENGRVNQCSSNFWLSVRPVPAPQGPVSSSDPARAELIALAEAIHIRAPEGSVAVPDIVGLDVVAAQDTLARAGLIPAGDALAFHQIEGRPVVAQTPDPGTIAPIGDEVSFTLAPEVTTTTSLPPEIEDVQLPIPDVPLECPLVRLAVSGGVYSPPEVHSGHTLRWHNGGGYDVLLSWPPQFGVVSEDTGVRELEVAGRPALMLDGGDGQNLVFDTGLPPGPCQYLEIGVYGGDSIEERESRAVALAERSISFPRFRTSGPPTWWACRLRRRSTCCLVPGSSPTGAPVRAWATSRRIRRRIPSHRSRPSRSGWCDSMSDALARLAAANNAEWCDLVCRSRAIRGTFDEQAWTSPTPRRTETSGPGPTA
jgi:hypothetical protein